eukprot:scaffold34915_cov17-Tisochrysis_lutea.AAC.3
MHDQHPLLDIHHWLHIDTPWCTEHGNMASIESSRIKKSRTPQAAHPPGYRVPFPHHGMIMQRTLHSGKRHNH